MGGHRDAARVPQVVAHRGASEDLAEHTLAAYLHAIEKGAGALEADVRLTRDGHLVCVHDRRVDRTSDGRGPVSSLELAELAQLDFGSWRPGGDPEEEPDRENDAASRILTLRRLCEVVAESGGGIELAIETKHPTRYAGLVESTLVDLLRGFGWARANPEKPPPVRVMSFSPLSLRRIHRLAPAVPTVQLLTRVPAMLDAVLPDWLPAVGPNVRVLHAAPAAVARMHDRGKQVHVWTVDDSRDVSLCLDLGVDAIITNRPAQVVEQVTDYFA